MKPANKPPLVAILSSNRVLVRSNPQNHYRPSDTRHCSRSKCYYVNVVLTQKNNISKTKPMKKDELKDKFSNASDAFFSHCEPINEEIGFTHVGQLDRSTASGYESSGNSPIFSFIRQALLFFPATFVLWIIAGEFTYMLLMGSNPFQLFPITILTVVSFLALLGLGDPRRLKDYVIPASIISVGVLAAFLTWLTNWDSFRPDQYGMLFFPVALVAPFIAKGLVDRGDKGD